MTEETRVASDDSLPANASSSASSTKPKKKRKWDQPAESMPSAGMHASGIFPLSNTGSFVGVTLPGVVTVPAAVLVNPVPASTGSIVQVLQPPSIQQQAAAAVQKLNQAKIQDELIAREIVINDAESSVRYKLTKRQWQEEIQKCTGAVVITRGKYRPSNVPSDGVKPLYLHISAGAHLRETAERIKAVDRAAAVVEEMLKQGPNSLQLASPFLPTLGDGGKGLSTCVFLGFDTDPTLNIAALIHGPNDQYINHIMNETGASVELRGRGSGHSESSGGNEEQQPLHLFLSSNEPKSLEAAKLLAENLLDTISSQCGASRWSTSKGYNAVPPPRQLSAGVQNSESAADSSLKADPMPAPPASSALVTGSSVPLLGGLPNGGQLQANMACPSQVPVTSGTCYSGYGGIYPQATPLQQVALALRQSHAPISSTVAPVTSEMNIVSEISASSSPGMEKRPPQKRKFKELPVAPASKGPGISDQEFEGLKPLQDTELAVRSISTMPAPKKLVQPSSNGAMPPPPPRTTPLPTPRTTPLPQAPSKTMPPPPKFPSSAPTPKAHGDNNSLGTTRIRPLPRPPSKDMPPPPPKFSSSVPVQKAPENNISLKKSDSANVPDTLIKLMEYGEEDDDPEEALEELSTNNSNSVVAPKPFWAV